MSSETPGLPSRDGRVHSGPQKNSSRPGTVVSSYKQMKIKRQQHQDAVQSARFERNSHFGNVLIDINTVEKIKLERQLRLLDLEKNMVVEGIFRKQRDFFVRRVFDKHDDLRFLKHKQQKQREQEDILPRNEDTTHGNINRKCKVSSHVTEEEIKATDEELQKTDRPTTNSKNSSQGDDASNAAEDASVQNRRETLRKQRSITDVLFLNDKTKENFRSRCASYPVPTTSRLVNHSIEKFKGLLLRKRAQKSESSKSSGSSSTGEVDTASQFSSSEVSATCHRIRYDSEKDSTRLTPIHDFDEESVFDSGEAVPSIVRTNDYPIGRKTVCWDAAISSTNSKNKHDTDKNKTDNVQKWIELIADAVRNKDIIKEDDAKAKESEQKVETRLARPRTSGGESIRSKQKCWQTSTAGIDSVTGRPLSTNHVGAKETETLLQKITGSLPQHLLKKQNAHVDMTTALGYRDRNQRLIHGERKAFHYPSSDARFQKLMSSLSPLKDVKPKNS